MFASDWIFALYTNVIPVKEVHKFLTQFFKQGWVFFYKFTLTFLKVLSSRILATEEISEIIDLIKAPITGRAFNHQCQESGGFLQTISQLWQPDSVKSVLGITFDSFCSDSGVWQKLIDASHRNFDGHITERQIALLFS